MAEDAGGDPHHIAWVKNLLNDEKARHDFCDKTFLEADEDKSGDLGVDEVVTLVFKICRSMTLKMPEKERIAELVRLCDKSGDGDLQKNEFRTAFKAVLKACLHEAEKETEEERAARLEAERLEAGKEAAEKAEAERLAAEKAAAEKAEAERLEAEKAAAEKAEAERLAAEKAAAEKAEAERIAAEKAAADKAAAEKAAAEKAAQNAAADASPSNPEAVMKAWTPKQIEIYTDTMQQFDAQLKIAEKALAFLKTNSNTASIKAKTQRTELMGSLPKLADAIDTINKGDKGNHEAMALAFGSTDRLTRLKAVLTAGGEFSQDPSELCVQYLMKEDPEVAGNSMHTKSYDHLKKSYEGAVNVVKDTANHARRKSSFDMLGRKPTGEFKEGYTA